MEAIDVFIPAPHSRLRAVIDRGSGIVGTPAREFLGQDGSDPLDEQRVIIDYEGNRFHAANMKTFADRVFHAAGRHEHRYPTVARSMVPRDELVLLGSFDGERIYVAESLCMDDWLGHGWDPAELHRSSQFA